MRNQRELRSLKFFACLLFCACAQARAAGAAPELPPAELVRRAVNNELLANASSGPRFMFRNDRRTAHVSQTKLIVETRDVTAGMLIAQNGQPLDQQQRQDELARLENYVRNPDELDKKRRREKEDADRIEKILRALPDAFVYQYDGSKPGSVEVGRKGDELVRLKFAPNPKYDPPSRVEQVLTGMGGTVLVDATEQRIAEIDGTLQKEVSFGWGIFGHLDKGGRFLVQQADAGGRHWEITRMELAFTGKILLFKKLDIRSSDVFSDFRQVPGDLNFAQAVELLKKESTEIWQRRTGPQSDHKPESR
jgi:hypothetical protein